MSNGPYGEGTQFVPAPFGAPVYVSLTDLLSDEYDESEVVHVWPADWDSTPSHRLTIGVLRQQYEAWELAQQQADAHIFRNDELTVEWGWRLRHGNHPHLVYRVSEEEAQQMLARSPDVTELVTRLVTAWEPSE